MTKEPTVSVRELLGELNYGKGLTLPESQRVITNETIVRVLAYIRNKKVAAKLANPKNYPAPKANNLLTLAQWEAQVGGQLSIGMLTGWTNAKRLDSKEVAQLIEEFRTEMVSKNKLYADFKAAFQTYLTKGYLSKTLAQVAWKAPEGANKHFTRGVSI